VLVLHTSVGDFCGYLEQIVVPDVSVWVSFRHLVSVAAFCGGFFGGLMEVEGGRRTMAQSAISSLDVRKQLHNLISRRKLVFAICCGLSKGVGRGRSFPHMIGQLSTVGE
jgi:hypothetical protein